ncbi:hypothetical protein I4F81_003509 [Pyropia yezoensis]|uniref:Uncharacterized protein n=1 Tax=Pyropia yezoensis TaxID=2788 RepID=A0ACC3BTJ6_PYRYE|nr:hypothetical protein I4F81_003509 [Neopyropia yezoensis]
MIPRVTSMDAPWRRVAAALPATVALLLVLILLMVVPGGSAVTTKRPGVAATATTAGDLRGGSKWLFPYFDDAQVLAFREQYKDLGVSFDQLMDAEAAGHLGAYEAAINAGRATLLNMHHAIMAYQAIMERLHDDDRCLDFVRQSTADEPDSCGVEKWRRCCRGTANDADQVLLCAKHEHLLHPPAITTNTHAANSYRVEPLPLRRTVVSGLPTGSIPPVPSAAQLLSRTQQQPRQAVERQGAAGCNGTVREAPPSEASAALAASMAALVADAAASAAAAQSEPTAARVTSTVTVVPFFFEDQYEEQEVEVEDVWATWCKEFLFFSAGCVEYCCTTLLAGSAVCDMSKNPDGCM